MIDAFVMEHDNKLKFIFQTNPCYGEENHGHNNNHPSNVFFINSILNNYHIDNTICHVPVHKIVKKPGKMDTIN
jgi:hypothetical protein